MSNDFMRDRPAKKCGYCGCNGKCLTLVRKTISILSIRKEYECTNPACKRARTTWEHFLTEKQTKLYVKRLREWLDASPNRYQRRKRQARLKELGLELPKAA